MITIYSLFLIKYYEEIGEKVIVINPLSIFFFPQYLIISSRTKLILPDSTPSIFDNAKVFQLLRFFLKLSLSWLKIFPTLINFNLFKNDENNFNELLKNLNGIKKNNIFLLKFFPSVYPSITESKIFYKVLEVLKKYDDKKHGEDTQKRELTIGLHLRLGDYKILKKYINYHFEPEYILEDDILKNIIKRIVNSPNNLIIFTNEPRNVEKYKSKLSYIFPFNKSVSLDVNKGIKSIKEMSKVDILIAPKSTFSLIAIIFGNIKKYILLDKKRTNYKEFNTNSIYQISSLLEEY